MTIRQTRVALWQGSQFVDAPLHAYGSQGWQDASLKVWTGSQWSDRVQFAPVITLPLPATTDYHNGWQTVGPVACIADPPIPISGPYSGTTPGFVWETSPDGVTWTARTGQTTRTYGNTSTSANIPVLGFIRFRCWNQLGTAITSTQLIAGPTGKPRIKNLLPATMADILTGTLTLYPPVGVISNPAVPVTMTAPTSRLTVPGFLWETSTDNGATWVRSGWPNRISRDFAGVRIPAGSILRFTCWNQAGADYGPEETYTQVRIV